MEHVTEYLGYYIHIQESNENGFDFNISKTNNFDNPIDGGVDYSYYSALDSAKLMIREMKGE